MITHTFTRANGKVVSGEEVIKIIADYVKQEPKAQYEFTVGTDSQAHGDKTKIAEVIAIRRVGHGGIYFSYIEYVDIISNLRKKIIEETHRSINNADGLLEGVQLILIDEGIDIDKLDIRFQIHCDIGKDGRTSEFIKDIVNWVQGLHYECLIKPRSYTASGVADKFSK